MEDCIFCKIVKGEIPSKKVYEDDYVTAFDDVNPAAPVHILVIPKKHFRNFAETDAEYIIAMQEAVKKIVVDLGVAEEGYRIVMNTGDNGGQTVYHLHMHILGGRFMTWPPG